VSASDRGTGREHADGYEHELRLLLERGVPRLGAPAQRMREVRRRVLRRRRRRFATLGAVVSVVAVAGGFAVLRPDVPPSSAGPPGGAATAPVPTPDAPPTPTADPSRGSVVRLDGLTFALPEGWRLTRPHTPSALVAYVSNQPLGARIPCPDPAVDGFACAPWARLGKGGVLVFFRLTKTPIGKAAAPGRFALEGPHLPNKDCRVLGGDQEVIGWGTPAGGAGQGVAANAYACLNHADDATTGAVLTVFDTAFYRGATSGSTGGGGRAGGG
jgi:hypothetical protein